MKKILLILLSLSLLLMVSCDNGKSDTMNESDNIDELIKNKDTEALQKNLVSYSKSGNLDMIRYMFDNLGDVKIDLNWNDSNNGTALGVACKSFTKNNKNNASEIVELLLSKGANPSKTSNRYYPIYLAVDNTQGDRHGDMDWDESYKIVNMLVEKGADVNLSNDISSIAYTPLAKVMKDSDDEIEAVKVISALASAPNANLNTKSHDRGETLLIQSVRHLPNSKETVKVLIEKGANLDLQDYEGYTALMLSVNYGENSGEKSEVIKMMIDKGANLNLQDRHGLTALMRACMWAGKLEYVKLLLEANPPADATIHSNDGNTVYGYSSGIVTDPDHTPEDEAIFAYLQSKGITQ